MCFNDKVRRQSLPTFSVESRTIVTLSYMESIMTEFNMIGVYIHIYTCVYIYTHTYIRKGWLYNEYRGKYHGDDHGIVNRDTRSGYCLAEPRDFYSSDVYNLPLASAK